MSSQQMVFILCNAEKNENDIDLCIVMPTMTEERLKERLSDLHIETEYGCSDHLKFEYGLDFIANGKFPTLKVKVKSDFWNNIVIKVADALALVETDVSLFTRELTAYYLSEMDDVNIPNPLRFEERIITIG